MVHTWHSRAILQQPEGETFWCASRYHRVSKFPEPARIEADPNAAWERFAPFAAYRPTSKKTRDVEAGPHLAFLRLKKDLLGNRRRYRENLERFVNDYGLLGLFFERYSAPILPEGKIFVLPEAGINRNGRLRQIDPGTEGMKQLLTLLQKQQFIKDEQEREAFLRGELRELIASPSELRFARKRFVGLWPPNSSGQQLDPELASWEEVRDEFGALLALDSSSSARVSVLSTREPCGSWKIAVEDFPSGPYSASKMLATRLNRELMGTFPYVSTGEDGQFERGWRCPSLLRVMYLMLYLDLTGGKAIRECASRGCSNYYRAEPQSRSVYCSERCANRASTRMGRGQEP